MLSIGDLSLQELRGGSRYDGKVMYQYLGIDSAATDTRPQTGMESATTTDISDGSETHGNEGQDMTTLVAGRRTHGAKNNRVFPGVPFGLSRLAESAATSRSPARRG
jgi:hypothetical protein